MSKKNMYEEKWKENENRAKQHIEMLGDKHQHAVLMTLDLGNEDPANRAVYWESIQKIYSTLENNPLGRGKHGSLVSAEVEQNIHLIVVGLEDAHSAYWEIASKLGNVIPKRGGGAHTKLEEYLAYQSKMMSNKLRDYHKAYLKGDKKVPTWSGKLNNKGGIRINHPKGGKK